ncbi:lipase maturation factor 2 [Phytophthora infestans T30-4]|uniref:Lipase maturation factor 2 n=1 Tax=Phytophthora infestans (strain T30-4) TaxID=403677 RepID=D0NCT8_PHYIT|nr:lipase maturation factor 2 [Phytophthora infestans T30-4]EEY55802.1 lipase maturation factor 2 [Phytophthora infestans T30-4]|eukprot:XP_002903378.1 lipase maturation factor 2 [Phytophthora infestans T30-4]
MLHFPRQFFLICICSVYALAFASIRAQVRGLFGENGIEPVDVYLRSIKLRYASESFDTSTFAWIVDKFPTLVWLHEPLQWTPSFCMEVICLAGVTTALLGMIRPAWRTAGPLILMWICYLSVVKCGQTFMQFQWDSFLLEVGVLAILLAPWCVDTTKYTFETPAAAVWTLRFLFFKFMLMSGAVKIQSRCPTWLELTALDFHFATQPLPLPLSWYALQAPPLINRLAVAVTLLIEGPWTFFLIAPHPTLRRIGAIQQTALQISILLTGNYNFFNLLTIILATVLLDVDNGATGCESDITLSQRESWITRVESAWHAFQTHPQVSNAMLACALSFCVYTWLEVFELTIQDDNQTHSFMELLLATRIRLLPTVEDTQAWLARILPRCTLFSTALVACSSSWQVMRCFSQSGRNSTAKKRLVLQLIYLLTTTVASLWVFTSSVVTLSVLDQSFQQSLPSFAILAYYSTEKYRFTSAYGLFRTMTGVGTVQLDNGHQVSVVARPEIILEGTQDGGLTWTPYHFKYKPGDMNTAPRLIAPFHPRLDWQMWFAALSDYHSAPWLVHLVAKLLEGSRDVKELLDTTRDPFPDAPPDAIRAQLYYYDFTRLDTLWNQALPTTKILDNSNDPQWWTRTFAKEYLPALERGNPSLTAFVEHHWPSIGSKLLPKTSEVSALHHWSNQVLRWLCSEPWSPVGLAASYVLAQSGIAAMFRWMRALTKLKLQ